MFAFAFAHGFALFLTPLCALVLSLVGEASQCLLHLALNVFFANFWLDRTLYLVLILIALGLCILVATVFLVALAAFALHLVGALLDVDFLFAAYSLAFLTVALAVSIA